MNGKEFNLFVYAILFSIFIFAVILLIKNMFDKVFLRL